MRSCKKPSNKMRKRSNRPTFQPERINILVLVSIPRGSLAPKGLSEMRLTP